MICPRCNHKGPETEFGKLWDQRKSPECKKCLAHYHREYRDKNPKKMLLIGAKRRAKANGRTFNLIEDDIKISERCPILGIELSRNTGNKRMHDRSPTIDRIDNTKGYTKDNIVVMSWRANRLKHDGTALEHRLIAAYIRTNIKD